MEKLEREWREDFSLPVQVARAQIAALRTAGDPEGRFRAKWQLVRNLYDAGYNAKQVREVFRFIDWMMHLRRDWERRFRADLAAYEEQSHMPYITSVERLAKAEGRVEGRAEGRAGGWSSRAGRRVRSEGGVAVLLRLLGRVCGLRYRRKWSSGFAAYRILEIETLSEAVLDFRTLDHVRTGSTPTPRNPPPSDPASVTVSEEFGEEEFPGNRPTRAKRGGMRQVRTRSTRTKEPK